MSVILSLSHTSKVLLVGANGLLARALIAAAPRDVQCVALTRAELDLTNEIAVRRAVELHQPDLVINGAAYNQVDRAENEGARDAIEGNALGVAYLAQTCRDESTSLVHFSTDYVFDGRKTTPYSEDDATNPLGIYASSKLAGENIALALNPRNAVIRVSRLFGPAFSAAESTLQKPASSFPLAMLQLAQKRDSIRVVNDQIGSPTYTPDLARAVWQLLQKTNGGLFHLSNAGEVAFDEYARAVFEIAKVECEVVGVTSEEYGAAARRPKYSALSNAKAQKTGVAPLRPWKEALREFLKSLN